jgi:hypothetical protein
LDILQPYPNIVHANAREPLTKKSFLSTLLDARLAVGRRSGQSARKGVIKSRLGLTGIEHRHHAAGDDRELAAVFEAVLGHAPTLRQKPEAGDSAPGRTEP